MSEVRKLGERGRYYVVAVECLGRSCFAPGEFQHRGATTSGSRNTGALSRCCLNNAYHGCPPKDSDRYKYSLSLHRERTGDGWRRA